MPIAAGTRLGPYEIVAPIGAGGMGEVYRALDTRLKRAVAIKVLPEAFARDPERLARFEREAELLASLNHQNIAHIYGVEDRALVMELVEGQTLAEKIKGTGLPIGDVLAFARQIVEALHAAHTQGIVHRDLKPANVKVRPDGMVKVLDFGLAKAIATVEPQDLSQMPTAGFGGTRQGVILGTTAYMSPEQSRGLAVDARTDIWAFGCVIFELLSGRRAFSGDTMPDTIAAILEREPDWTALPTLTPAPLSQLVRQCLEKDAARRPTSMADVREALDRLAPAGASPHSGPDRPTRPAATERRTSLSLAIAAVAVVGIGVAAWRFLPSGLRSPASSRVAVGVSPATALLGSHPLERTPFARWRPSRTAIALSPDGRTLAFTAHKDGDEQLYVRALDQPEAIPLAGTAGADNPFFSPDGAWIGFWAAGGLRKVPVGGGAVVKLCDTEIIYGADWADDTIVFANRLSIWRVPARGGQASDVTRRNVSTGEPRQVLPRVLPGGAWLIFTVLPTLNDWETARVTAQSLATGERKVLVSGATDARYVPTGYLLYMRLGALMAAPFDATKAEITGGEVAVVDRVMQSVNSTVPNALDTGAGQFAFSASGTLAFVAGGVHPDFVGTLEWIGRDGAIETVSAPPRPYLAPRISPDGRHILVGTFGLRDANIWRYNIAGRSLTRLTVEGRAEHPIWSGDGARFASAVSLKAPYQLTVMAADGGGRPTTIANGQNQFPAAWTPDGRALITTVSGDINLVPLADENRPGVAVDPAKTLLVTPFTERGLDLSPDGRWLAYSNNETGTNEVYVRSFPDLAGKRRISTDGGGEPAWSRDGRKLIFVKRRPSAAGEVPEFFEVDVRPGATFSSGVPRKLFALEAGRYTSDAVLRNYDITADASRFLLVREDYPPDGSPLDVVQVVEHWFSDLGRLVPSEK